MKDSDKTLLERYNKLLVEKNKTVNLTAHKTEEASWQNNILDSLLFVDYFPKQARLLDLGSGCGCPAIPLKIVLPNLNITMIDSVGKKVDFLNQATAYLELNIVTMTDAAPQYMVDAVIPPHITAIHTRIEDYAAKHHETFDIVTARAVAELPTLLEYALPFLKVGGRLFAYKGKNWQDELDKSKHALRELGGEFTGVKTAALDDKERVLLIITKKHSAPTKYPRGKNLPRLKPLI